ncbi:hypothetical protein [Congregibacter litoralis]|uniref:Uncharacterized protein n=1 Tax=Congregibacter litoralis KT71 TaxID=314285 RepID=A4ABD7_9GAMM|nr:hypothetical protein [Congregibacter litoralis]EAQ96691.1 hypothetical protein KT71_06699 [Congregibacter litoralis KT71]
MEPDLFAINWDTLAEALAVVVVLSFVIERALSLVFEHRKFIDRFDDSNLKELIALGVSLGVVMKWQFDLISIIFIGDENTFLGYVITAGVIAGGSKGAVKLFHDVLGMKSSARLEKDDKKYKDQDSE